MGEMQRCVGLLCPLQRRIAGLLEVFLVLNQSNQLTSNRFRDDCNGMFDKALGVFARKEEHKRIRFITGPHLVVLRHVDAYWFDGLTNRQGRTTF